MQLLLDMLVVGEQEVRPSGLSWGYEGVHVATDTPKNGLGVSAVESMFANGVEGTSFGREEGILKIPLLHEPNLDGLLSQYWPTRWRGLLLGVKRGS